MGSRSLPLFLLLSCLFAGTVLARKKNSFTPFDMVDDYVEKFRSNLIKMFEDAERFRFDEELRSNSIEMIERAGQESQIAEEEKNEEHEYDFIVIGAGNAGSVIASRLSEEPRWKVLLLEAGNEMTEITEIPSLHPRLMNSPYAWGYYTVPQNTTCLNSEDTKCLIKKGKGVGGDSAVNDMLYTRGHPRDYDIWADTGLKGWCWESLEPYFRNIETAHLKNMDRKYRHYGGPLHLENFNFATKISEHLLSTCEQHYKIIDYNGKERLGFGHPQVIARDGKRYSVAKAYLEHAILRENLKLKLNSRVIKILIGEHTKEATGVQYIHDGKIHIAKAKKEIILSAGAISSPQILLLSGIGPEEELKHLEIFPHINDLKVGSHLKDHISFTLNFLYNNETHEYHPSINKNEDLVKYLKDCTGSMTTNGLELVGFLKTKISKHDTDYPDIQLLIRREHYKPECNYWNIEQRYDDTKCGPHNRLSIEIVLLHPKSSGYLKLVDRDPLHQPLINPYGLSDEEEEDIETLLEGVHEVLKLVDSEGLKKVGLELEEPHVPKCEKLTKGDRWKCLIRYLGTYRGDITGTARMGIEGDRLAVVNEKLKVVGVHKLRVADASIVPVTLSGNVMGPEVVIGEKAAYFIKQDWLHYKCY